MFDMSLVVDPGKDLLLEGVLMLRGPQEMHDDCLIVLIWFCQVQEYHWLVAPAVVILVLTIHHFAKVCHDNNLFMFGNLKVILAEEGHTVVIAL